MSRAIVCGGRKYNDREAVWAALNRLRDRACTECNGTGTGPDKIDGPGDVYQDACDCCAGSGREPLTIIEGGAAGADRLAAQWAAFYRVPCRRYAADWGTYGRAAGPIRNQLMLTKELPDVVVAFPGGAGTADMTRRATAAGVSVVQPGDPR